MAVGQFHPTKSADRTCQLLRLIADRGPMSHSEIAQGLGIPKSSATALIGTLESQSFLTRDHEGRKFRLGPQILYLAHQLVAQVDLIRIGQPIVEQLMRDTQESAALGIAVDADLVVIGKANCLQPLQRTMQLGERAPLHATAGGKAILAFLSEEHIASLYAGTRLPGVTGKTIRSVKALMQELRSIRDGDPALSKEELIDGIIAIGMPIFDGGGAPIASLSIAVPAIRFDSRRLQFLSAAIRKACDRISRECGYEQRIPRRRKKAA